MPSTRRDCLKHLLALGASCVPAGTLAGAADPEVPRPASDAASGISSYSDQGGRPDGVQVMVNRGHVYVGHMFSDGVTVLDAADPRRLKPVGFFTAGTNTRTHHLQVSDDLLLLANGANIVAMQSYDDMRGYFENTLADSITNRKKFRSGLSIHDISRPGEMQRDRLSRDARVRHQPPVVDRRPLRLRGRALRRLHGSHPVHRRSADDHEARDRGAVVAAGHAPGGRRNAGVAERPARGAPSHDRGRRRSATGPGATRGFTIHDLSDPARPKLLAHLNWSPPYPGGTHTPLPLPGRKLVVVADEANAERCAKGTFHTFIVDVRAPENPVPIATLPTPSGRDFCGLGTFGPHNLYENRPAGFQSETTIFATYNNAGVRVFDIANQFAPRELASWVPPTPGQADRPAAQRGARAAKSADLFVTRDGLIYVSDWNAGLNVLDTGDRPARQIANRR